MQGLTLDVRAELAPTGSGKKRVADRKVRTMI